MVERVGGAGGASPAKHWMQLVNGPDGGGGARGGGGREGEVEVEVEVGVDATSRSVEGAAGEPIVRRLVCGAAEDEREARALDSGRVANLREVKADVLGRNVDDVQDGDGRVCAEEAALVGAAQRREGETKIVVAVAVAPRVGAPARQELARAVRRVEYDLAVRCHQRVPRCLGHHPQLGVAPCCQGQGWSPSQSEPRSAATPPP